jgi:nucleotide-binding universal stress UspA family protein
MALDRGVAASFGHPHADLHVIGVLDEHRGLGHLRPGHKVDFQAAEEARDEINAVVDRKIEKPTPNDLHLYIHARIGHPAEQILKLAAEANADVILVGTHGRRGVKRWLLGSVAERVVRHAGCPVLVVREKSYTEMAPAEELTPEPPCPDCVATRERTQGEHWWCEPHEQPHERPHRYSYRGASVMDPNDQSNSILW